MIDSSQASNSFTHICELSSPILQPIGEAIMLFKIFIPLILIVICTFDIAKMVISNKKDTGKKSLKTMALRIVLSLAVFFVPAIFILVFNITAPGFNNIRNKSGLDYGVCYDCLFKPTSDTCKTAVKNANIELFE